MNSRLAAAIFSGSLLLARFSAAQTPSAQASSVTETDRAAKLGRLLGTPGGTSPVDLSRPGFDTILESTGNDTDVSVHVGFKTRSWLFDSTLRSDVNRDDSVTAVAAANREPLSSTGSVTFGATLATGLNFDVDSFGMLDVCGGRTPCATNNTALPDDVREQLRSLIKLKTAKTFGVKAMITRPNFKYRLTPDAADIPNERHTGLAITGGVGYLWPTQVYIGASAGFERTWEAAGDPVNYCQPVSGVGMVSECEATVLGTPTRQDGPVFAAVVRYFASSFIVAPRFEDRETKGLKTLDIPFYFIPQSNGPKLTGGVMYRLKNGDSSIFAFVGTAVPAFGMP